MDFLRSLPAENYHTLVETRRVGLSGTSNFVDRFAGQAEGQDKALLQNGYSLVSVRRNVCDDSSAAGLSTDSVAWICTYWWSAQSDLYRLYGIDIARYCLVCPSTARKLHLCLLCSSY